VHLHNLLLVLVSVKSIVLCLMASMTKCMGIHKNFIWFDLTRLGYISVSYCIQRADDRQTILQ
jgi:hypothetical protein